MLMFLDLPYILYYYSIYIHILIIIFLLLHFCVEVLETKVKKKQDLWETVEILETKVKKLEQLLRLKDAKIQVIYACMHAYMYVCMYVYVHKCYVLTNPPIPSSRCKCFVFLRPV